MLTGVTKKAAALEKNFRYLRLGLMLPAGELRRAWVWRRLLREGWDDRALYTAEQLKGRLGLQRVVHGKLVKTTINRPPVPA